MVIFDIQEMFKKYHENEQLNLIKSFERHLEIKTKII